MVNEDDIEFDEKDQELAQLHI